MERVDAQAAGGLSLPRTGRARAAVRGSFWSTINALVPALVAAIIFAITSRYLSPTEFGLVAFATTLTLLASAVGPGGFGDALVQRESIDERHLNSVFWLCTVAGILLCAALVLISPLVAFWFGDDRLAGLLALLSLRIVFDMAAIVPNALLVRSMSFGRLALRTTIAAIISGAICLVLLSFGYGLWALAVSQLATSVSSTIGSVLSVDWRPKLSFDKVALRDVKTYGAFASGQRIVQMVNFDQLLIGPLIDAHSLGIFSFVKRIHLLLNDMIGGGLRQVSFSVLSSMQSEPEKLRQTYLFATFVSSAVSFPVFVGLGAVATDLIPLVFGPHWLEAVPALQAFCLLGLITCIGLLQSALINSQGKAAWWFYYQVTQQALTIGVILATFSFGVTVVAFALVAKTILLWPATVRKTLRLLGMGFWTYAKSFVEPAVACLAMLGAIALLRVWTADQMPIVTVILRIAVGGAVYIAVLAALAHSRLRHLMQMLISRKG